MLDNREKKTLPFFGLAATILTKTKNRLKYFLHLFDELSKMFFFVLLYDQ